MNSREEFLSQIMWQEIFWPHPLTESAVANLLRQWAAQMHAPQIILEARASHSGIQYLIGAQIRHAASLRRDIEQLIPGTIVVASGDSRELAAAARRLSLSSPAQSLQSRDQEGSTRSILAALAPVRGKELLILQLVLGTRLAPSLPPHQLPRAHQSLASLLLTGQQVEKRAAITRDVTAKQSDHGYLARIRIGVTATTEDRRRSLIKGILSALSTLVAPGMQLHNHPERVEKLNRPAAEWSYWAPSQRLSVAEVQHLSAWPVGSPEVPHPGQPPIHPRPLRPTFDIKPTDRIVARSTAPGRDRLLGLSAADSCQHLWTMGPTGVGKSALLLSLIRQDLDAGHAVVVIEPKDLIHDVLKVIPQNRRDAVVLLDALDADPVGINPLDRAGRTPALVADHLFGVFHALYGDQLGPRSSDILRHSLQALAEREDASLVMLPLLLSNPGFRRSITQRAAHQDPFAAGPFWHWYNNLAPDAATQVIAPLMNKLRPLLDPHLRNVLAQRNPRFNIRQVVRDKKILLVPLQKGVVGPQAAELLGAVVVAELWQAIRERAVTPPENREPIMVYLDEVQEYLRLPTELGDALATSRSLGAAFHVAHQFRDQLPPSMNAAFEANCRSRVFFQLSPRDAKAVASGTPQLEAEDFTALPAFHVYAQLVHDSAVQPWASGVTLPPPKPTSDPTDIRRRSRTLYGQPISAIEAGLLDLLDQSAPEDIGGSRRRRSTS
jgi:hypothetical protein